MITIIHLNNVRGHRPILVEPKRQRNETLHFTNNHAGHQRAITLHTLDEFLLPTPPHLYFRLLLPTDPVETLKWKVAYSYRLLGNLKLSTSRLLGVMA